MKMSSIRRRALMVVGATAVAIGVAIATSPGASAHTCAKVTAFVNGAQTPIGSCHAPGTQPIGDICVHGGLIPVGETGATWNVCVQSPVISPA